MKSKLWKCWQYTKTKKKLEADGKLSEGIGGFSHPSTHDSAIVVDDKIGS